MKPYEMKPRSGSPAFTSRKISSNDALQALGRIQGTVPANIKNDVEFLRANIYMATDRPNDAIEVLNHLQNDPSLAGFVAYNLGIALLQAGKKQEAVEQLDKAGRLPASDPAGLAIRDKPNKMPSSHKQRTRRHQLAPS